MITQPATQITVDMVTPTKGLITIHGTELGGTILNDARRGAGKGAGWTAEDTDGQTLGNSLRGARKAAETVARTQGVTGPVTITIDEEWRLTGARD